jgi:hypothetical protein
MARLEPQYRAALDIPKEKRTKDQQEKATYAMRMLDVKYEELLAVMPAALRDQRAALRRQMHALELNAPSPLPHALSVADNPTSSCDADLERRRCRAAGRRGATALLERDPT